MAIEIRELIIKATITQDRATGGAQTSEGTQSGNVNASNEQIINACVEKVMEILRKKNQR